LKKVSIRKKARKKVNKKTYKNLQNKFSLFFSNNFSPQKFVSFKIKLFFTKVDKKISTLFILNTFAKSGKFIIKN
jgi:hypothetical protein